MFPALMAVSFALFGIAIVALTATAGARTAPPAAGEKSDAPDAGMMAQLEAVINERVAQLDEKLVDLHTRTASQLKADLDGAEERLRELEKDVAAKLETAAEGAGGAVPSTADIPDLKHIMRERMEQFDAKIIDMHNRVAQRIQQAADEAEEKIRALGQGAGGGVDAEQLKKIILEELAKFDKRITALQAGGGEGGADLAERLRRIEEQLAASAGEGGGAAGTEVAERLERLEKQIGALAERGVPGEGGPPAGAASPDVEQIVNERLAQFDEKIIDMHTRAAQRLEQVAQETEEKIKARGEGAPAGLDAEVFEKLRELEQRIENLPSAPAPAPGSTPPNWEGTGLDPEKLMKERLEQFDAKLIDMHTRAAKRLGDVTDEMEQRIMQLGEGAGKDVSERLTELETQVRVLLDMVNKDG